ncbi:MAG: ABC transporter permease/substrate-binding protein [Acidobacteriota bacterium]
MRLIEFWLSHKAEFLAAIAQHLTLVVVATLFAVGVGLPLGVISFKRPRLGTPLLGIANILQTIPSLALFGFLIPLPFIGGIGPKAALLALVLYALLPVMRTTVSGLQSVDPSAREAGIAMGMTTRQLLFQVELPLARPSIIAGIRVATVAGVGTATIAAAIGAGGLGEYIFRGVAMVNSTVILAGAVPAALLALAADLGLAGLERSMEPGHRRASRPVVYAAIAGGLLVVLLIAGLAFYERSGSSIRVGSKNFTEQLILGEICAQAIEQNTDLKVSRKLNLGGTLVCEAAMRARDLDVYVEYTGTALTAVLKQPVSHDAAEVERRVTEGYAHVGRSVLPALGFNNTFAILVRGETAKRLGLRTISDAAKYSREWRAGFGPEFLDREDGFKGLASTYNLAFKEPPRAMDLSLTYRALAGGQVDLIAGDSTNGLIDKLDLAMLEDDRNYFPPYQAVPLIRTEVLLAHPELLKVFESLRNKVSEKEMRRMNYEADVEQREAAAIARDFLERNK